MKRHFIFNLLLLICGYFVFHYLMPKFREHCSSLRGKKQPDTSSSLWWSELQCSRNVDIKQWIKIPERTQKLFSAFSKDILFLEIKYKCTKTKITITKTYKNK